MIKLDGSLSLKTINGRYGLFNVGILSTDIGEFSVKDAMLDQYDEGVYQGSFAISQVFAAGNSISGGRFIVETRATLDSISLEVIKDLPDEAPVPDVPADPIDEQPKREPLPANVQSTDDDDPTALFGLLWPLGEQVKLDPTIDRAELRRQCDYLKAHGYTFNPKGQAWTKTS